MGFEDVVFLFGRSVVEIVPAGWRNDGDWRRCQRDRTVRHGRRRDDFKLHVRKVSGMEKLQLKRTIEIEKITEAGGRYGMSYSIFRQVRVDGVGGLAQPTEQVYLIVIVVLNQFLFAIYVITITCIEMFGGNTAFQHAELNEIVGEGFL